MITHFKYWNKWRKKFPTAYSKWYKFLVLIGLKKPYTLKLMIFTDKYRGAMAALNSLAEIMSQTSNKDNNKNIEKKDDNHDEQ